MTHRIRWWAGTRQQAGRVLLSIRTLPDLAALDCRKLTDQQISLLDETFEDFALRPLLPTNEAWRDQTRRELDEAVLCDTLRLHTAADADRTELLESLTVLRGLLIKRSRRATPTRTRPRTSTGWPSGEKPSHARNSDHAGTG